VGAFGYTGSFLFNAASFLFSALCISRLRLPGRGFRPAAAVHSEAGIARPWHEYKEGLRYMRSRPLILGVDRRSPQKHEKITKRKLQVYSVRVDRHRSSNMVMEWRQSVTLKNDYFDNESWPNPWASRTNGDTWRQNGEYVGEFLTV